MTSASATALSTQPRRKRPVTAHPAFAAMLGVWGAALGGLSIMVLPDALIEAGARAAGSDLLISEARLALSAALASVLGLGCLALGKLAGRSHRAAAVTQAATEPDVIDPAVDLGSPSLDAPLEAGKGLLPDAEAKEEAAADDATWPPAGPGEAEGERAADLPERAGEAAAWIRRELDLGEFADIPGRNAVWVEDPAPELGDACEPMAKPAAPSAIARLRAVPPAELSLCEMVERLAAALQEYQATQEVGDVASDDDAGAREALLDEALGALGRVTARGFAEQGPTEFVEARRGAA